MTASAGCRRSPFSRGQPASLSLAINCLLDGGAYGTTRCRSAGRRPPWQFTSAAFTGLLQQHGGAISMDGKGCWRDNIFVERLWRSIKYEEVYLHAYASVSEAKAEIGRHLAQYNAARPHSSLGDQTPDEAYFTPRPLRAAA